VQAEDGPQTFGFGVFVPGILPIDAGDFTSRSVVCRGRFTPKFFYLCGAAASL
jgi:hypothetical protein